MSLPTVPNGPTHDDVRNGINAALTAADAAISTAQAAATAAVSAATTAQSALTAHAANTSNPHNVTAAQVGALTQTAADARYALFSIGTTAQRPVSPSQGWLHYDTTYNKPTWWNGSTWIDGLGADLSSGVLDGSNPNASIFIAIL